MNKYLFVYGTLMSSHDGMMSKRLQSVSRLIGNGYVKGALYALGGFPGFKRQGNTTAIGELVELSAPNAALEWLDAYEGVPNLYTREEIDVTCGAEVFKAWVYVYQGNPDPYSLIESGSWSKSFTYPEFPAPHRVST
jgi:gamma-glutamylcyclotransferase (GGCT)/AIG2-like uncharacterized protein YtfP